MTPRQLEVSITNDKFKGRIRTTEDAHATQRAAELITRTVSHFRSKDRCWGSSESSRETSKALDSLSVDDFSTSGVVPNVLNDSDDIIVWQEERRLVFVYLLDEDVYSLRSPVMVKRCVADSWSGILNPGRCNRIMVKVVGGVSTSALGRRRLGDD